MQHFPLELVRADPNLKEAGFQCELPSFLGEVVVGFLLIELVLCWFSNRTTGLRLRVKIILYPWSLADTAAPEHGTEKALTWVCGISRQDGLTIGSPSLCWSLILHLFASDIGKSTQAHAAHFRRCKGRLVLKHAHPRVLAAGMPLLTDAASAVSEDLIPGHESFRSLLLEICCCLMLLIDL